MKTLKTGSQISKFSYMNNFSLRNLIKKKNKDLLLKKKNNLKLIENKLA
jgi:hypothetical protein